MSLSSIKSIECSCGEVFEAEIWSSVNACEDPGLKTALMCGELNLVLCPACSKMFYADDFLLYHDSENELLAFVYPEGRACEEKKLRREMAESMDIFKNEAGEDVTLCYDPLLIFGMDRLAVILKEEQDITDEEDILEYLSSELGLTLLKLKPSYAREKEIPKIIPEVPSKERSRERIIRGLKILVQKNDLLEHYCSLLGRVQNDESWDLDETRVLRKKVPGESNKGGPV